MDVGTSKDNVFILSEGEVSNFLTSMDYYEGNFSLCNMCTWTRTRNNNNTYAVYVKRGRCDSGCNMDSKQSYAVRPVMYLKNE